MWVINLVLMYYLFRTNVSGILNNNRKKKDFVRLNDGYHFCVIVIIIVKCKVLATSWKLNMRAQFYNNEVCIR